MSRLPIIIFVLISLPSFADVKDCHRQVSQADKSECMMFEKDRAIGRLMTEITKECAEKKEIRESKGGSIYPMLIDECMIKEINSLWKYVDED
jgi:uncharacterized protein YecT (DUF1311 family)